MRSTPSLDLPALLVVEQWPSSGTHDVRGDYVETFWLPVIGPSSLLLARRLARAIALRGPVVAIPSAELAAALGLGAGTNRNSPLARTVNRLCTFNWARWTVDGYLQVRTSVHDVSPRNWERLPDLVRDEQGVPA